jgi:uncharacterized protein (TIGR03083 family)
MCVMTREELLATWQESAASVINLCTSLTDDEWNAPTPCPGWSVADVVAHLIDLESWGAGDPRPVIEIDWSTLPHIKNAVGRVTEVGVVARRGMPPAQLLSEYRSVMMRRVAHLSGITGNVPSPFGGDIPVEQSLSMRILDTWVHEQDIRDAIGQPGGLTTSGALVTGHMLLRGLPKAWGKKVAPPVGSTLRVTVTGPGVSADQTVVITEDGRAQLVSGDSEWGEPTVHLTMPWPAFFQAASGRVDVSSPQWRESVSIMGPADLVDSTLVALNSVP